MTSQQVPRAKKVQSQPVRVAIYTRKSTVKGLDSEDNSLTFQREACQDFIRAKKAQGWRANSKHYDDGGFTGANTDRPGLQELLKDAKAGKFEVIAVYKVDRISRSLADLVTMVGEFQKLNIEFVSVSQSFDTTQSIGRLILNILASFGQFERETIAERIRDKIGSARRKGKYVGGKPVLGFDVDKENRRLVINESEAKVVRSIFDAYLRHGAAQPVLEDLNARNIRTKRWVTQAGKVLGDKPINRQYLMSLLKNRHYVGQVVYHDEVYEGEHEALVDPEVFEQVQAMLDRNKYRDRAVRGAKKHARYDVLLRGLIFCAHSGEPMKPTYTKKKGRRYFYYICSRQVRFGSCNCERKRIAAFRIEKDVIGEIRRIGSDRGLVNSMVNDAAGQYEQTRVELTRRLAECKKQRKRLKGKINYQKGKTDESGDRAALEADLERLETELAGIESNLASLAPGFTAADFRSALGLFNPIWDSLPFEERARLLGLLVERVEYNGNEGRYGTFELFFRETGIKALGEMSREASHAS